MEFVPMAALALLVYQGMKFLRGLLGRDWNTVVTILVAWVVGVVALVLVAQTDFAGGIAVGDFTLATLNGASLVFVGLTIASLGSGFNDVIGAVDNHRSTRLPHLIEGTAVHDV